MSLPDFLFLGSEDAPGESSLEKRHGDGWRMMGIADEGGDALWWAAEKRGSCEGRMRNDAMGSRMRAA